MTQDSLRSLWTGLRKVATQNRKLRINLVCKVSFLVLYNGNFENCKFNKGLKTLLNNQVLFN